VPRGFNPPLTACCLALALLAGCGEDELGPTSTEPSRSKPRPQESAEPATVPPSRCPAGVPECREAEGRIVYVERVDPDGDGDAHFVLADTDSVTGPGVTVVDVPPRLRPNPLPGVGDHLSAAGSVATGSYGQSQVEAVALGG
jgi:hypothetical protein